MSCIVAIGLLWTQAAPADLQPKEMELSVSTIGRCSGSAMMCEAPAANARKFMEPQSFLNVDGEHLLVHELLDIIDGAFYDLRNEEGGPADSSASHTYNGRSVAELREEADSRKFNSRDATYKEMRRIVSKLGDKYSRFLSQSEAEYLKK
jgi:hypothetical protein